MDLFLPIQANQQVDVFGWQRYLGIEKDFLDAQYYVSFDLTDVYSEFFTREIIFLGAEIESAFKELCSRLGNTSAGNISQYKTTILGEYPCIEDIGIINKRNNSISKPFEQWNIKSIAWWGVYTGIKHNIVDRHATLKIAMDMLQAFELLLFCISATNGNFMIKLSEMPKLFIPELNTSHFTLYSNMDEFVHRYDGRQIIQRLKGIK